MISKKYIVYILQSEKDSSYYIGYTQDIESRLRQHNQGRSKYTKGHIPYTLIYAEEYIDKSGAKQREKYLKSYKNISTFLKSRVPPSKARD